MASECGIAATNVGGIPEVLVDGQNGLMFNPGDVDALVETLVSLIEDSEGRHALARKARETVLDRFKWSDAAARTAAHYQEVKDKHSSGRRRPRTRRRG
jgi:glycosyltransferase involved in cell wall biosynthesis